MPLFHVDNNLVLNQFDSEPVFSRQQQGEYREGYLARGATVGIYVRQCLQYLGVRGDHIAIRTFYRGMTDYLQNLEQEKEIRVYGTQFLLENLNRTDKLSIVDDVYSTGRNIEAVLRRLQRKAKRNMPLDTRLAMPFFKPAHSKMNRIPDYYLRETDNWLVLPYELTGLSEADIREHKPWVLPFLRLDITT